MVNRCCVKTCKQHFDYKPQHTQGAKWKLHRMPKAGDSRRQAWLDALGLPSADKTLYVCSMHFVDSDYTPNRFLQPEAVPSKNLGTSPATATSPASSAEPLTPSPAGPSAALDHPATAVTPSPAGPSAALDHPATAVASTLPTPETSATSAAPLVSTPHGHQLRAGKRRWSGSSADERPSEMSTSDGQRERDIQPSTEEETVEESVSDGDVDDSDGDREGGGDCRRLPVRTAVLTEPCLDGLLELARVRCHCGQTCPPTVQRVRMAFNVEWTCSTCGPRWAWTSVSTDLTAHRQVGAARTTR
ncbi:segmentation protein Runt-like isoform X4 [Amphibalanus amphitrite]|nr:segmentation protein Runt-like isoform X4 [Amphibalanus amphitrite]XP_043201888.1 segmentation protein Runt-like isoform X4 [Amphibalanus amphitrite]